VKSSLSPSDPVVSLFPLLPTGSGTASSPSSPHTWSEVARAKPISNPVSSSSGVLFAQHASSTPTFSSLRPRGCHSSKLTACWRRLLHAHPPSGFHTALSLPIWVSPRREHSHQRLLRRSCPTLSTPTRLMQPPLSKSTHVALTRSSLLRLNSL
jgi:hypothetical protein